MKESRVHSGDGSPKLYIDGERTLPILFGLSDIPGSAANTLYAQKNIANFAAQGFHLVTADAALRDGWHKISPFEWEPIQEEIASVMQADPDTGVLLRLHVNPPYWWMRDNPEECARYRDFPIEDDGDMPRLIRGDFENRLRVSLASEKWLREAGECLRLFCENVWDTPEGRAVVGIQVACGAFGEWHQWGPDRSQPMVKRFRRLLREKYATDEALQKAWGNRHVTFDTARFVPEMEQRGDDGLFRDPVRSRDIMDSQLCVQTSTAEAIIRMCEIVKASWGRPVLAGSFYGYYIGTNKNIGGHLMTEMIYKRRDVVDFLCGPFPYMENRKPEGVPLQRALIESNRLRGVLWLTEMDQHPAGTADFIGGDPNRMDETIAMLRRNVLQPLLAGGGLWFYDHRLIPRFVGPNSKNPYAGSIYRKTGWWDNPVLLEEIGQLRRIAGKYALRPYRAAADVLVVYSSEANFSLASSVDDEYIVLEAVARTGAAYDCIYLNELDVADMARYRVVIFANAWSPDAQTRTLIREKTAGKQVVWLYAAGYSDGTRLSVEGIRDITGIGVKRVSPQKSWRSLASGEEIAVKSGGFEPFFAVDESQAETLAVYPDSGDVAAARLGNSWYFACPAIDINTMKRIVREAGAHVYCDAGDPVLTGAGLTALYSFEGGERVMTFRNGVTTTCVLPPLTTALFDAETGERLL